jgi:hypothetical protein
MKTFSLEDLKRQAIEIFKRNPDAKLVYATTDGNIFLGKNKNSAELHAKSTGGLKIYEITNPNYKTAAIADTDEDTSFKDHEGKKDKVKENQIPPAKPLTDKQKKAAKAKAKREANKKNKK